MGGAGHYQRPGKLWKLLHRDRCAFDRRAGCECSLWHHLHQPGSSAVRDTVHHRGQRPGQWPAFSVHVCAVELFARAIPIPISTGAPMSRSAVSRDMTFTTAHRTPKSGCFRSNGRPAPTRSSARAMSAPRAIASGFSSSRTPGNPSLCLSLSQPSEVQPGTLTCGPGGEDTVYYPIGGGQVNGTRGPLGANFGSNALQSDDWPCQLQRTRTQRPSHAADGLNSPPPIPTASRWISHRTSAEEVNPFNPALSYALSSFDVKHNFVLSYEYQLPFDRFFRPNRLKPGMVSFRDHALRQRLSDNHGQQWRQFADRDKSKRDQQQQHR